MQSDKDDSDDDIIITKSEHNPNLKLHEDDANSNLETKPTEHLMSIINDNHQLIINIP